MSLIGISVALIPFFFYWEHIRVRSHLPALIPNRLWRNRAFTSICISVFLIWGAFSSLEQVFSFWFQLVQRLSPAQASVRFLPQAVMGFIIFLAMGLLVQHVDAVLLVLVASLASATGPIIMALSDRHDSYWKAGFPAVSLLIAVADCIYTISNLVISGSFPVETQALAGGVFNTVAQLGKSLGLALSAVISEVISANSRAQDDVDRLVQGYRAVFWFCLGMYLAALGASVWGLRKAGKVGKAG